MDRNLVWLSCRHRRQSVTLRRPFAVVARVPAMRRVAAMIALVEDCGFTPFSRPPVLCYGGYVGVDRYVGHGNTP